MTDDHKDNTKEFVNRPEPEKSSEPNANRRDFLKVVGGACLVVPLVATGCQLINYMSPAQDQLAAASSEVDISSLGEGQTMKTVWRGKPVFIKNRTPAELEVINAVDLKDLKDPQVDTERVKANKQNILVVVGVCTHLGCIPVSGQGEFGGWFCPCHGSHYDASGRVRKGPAPRNLEVPPYQFSEDSKKIVIG